MIEFILQFVLTYQNTRSVSRMINFIIIVRKKITHHQRMVNFDREIQYAHRKKADLKMVSNIFMELY